MIQRVQNTPQRQKFGMKSEFQTGKAVLNAIAMKKILPHQSLVTENIFNTPLSDHIAIQICPLEDNCKTVVLNLINMHKHILKPVLLVQKDKPSSLDEMAGKIFNLDNIGEIIKRNVDKIDQDNIEANTARCICPEPEPKNPENTLIRMLNFFSKENRNLVNFSDQEKMLKTLKTNLKEHIKTGSQTISIHLLNAKNIGKTTGEDIFEIQEIQ